MLDEAAAPLNRPLALGIAARKVVALFDEGDGLTARVAPAHSGAASDAGGVLEEEAGAAPTDKGTLHCTWEMDGEDGKLAGPGRCDRCLPIMARS